MKRLATLGKALNEALGKYLDDYHEARPHQAPGPFKPNQFRANLAITA